MATPGALETLEDCNDSTNKDAGLYSVERAYVHSPRASRSRSIPWWLVGRRLGTLLQPLHALWQVSCQLSVSSKFILYRDMANDDQAIALLRPLAMSSSSQRSLWH